MPYLTPDSAPSTTICRTIVIPDDLKWKAIVNGALSELFKSWNFEKDGDLTPQETADFFYQMWSDFHESECAVSPFMGEVRTTASPNIPSKWLACRGQALERTDYPDLFAEIGTLYGGSFGGSTVFNLPDLRDKFIMCWPDLGDPLGATGGVANVTLTTNQIPAHSHNELSNLGANTFGSAGGTSRVLLSSSSAPSNNTIQKTGLEGGGASHTNIPPYLYLQAIIYTGVP